MRSSVWSSDVCSSDLDNLFGPDGFYVLHAMDSEVDHALGKGAVQFLGPKRFAANVSERPILYAVAIGPHSNDVDRILVPPVRSAQGRRHHMRLNQCQWRSSGAQAQGTGERRIVKI